MQNAATHDVLRLLDVATLLNVVGVAELLGLGDALGLVGVATLALPGGEALLLASTCPTQHIPPTSSTENNWS